jgi:hypothetical protein
MTVHHHIDRLEALIRDAKKRPILALRIDHGAMLDVLEALYADLLAQTAPTEDGRVRRRAAGVWAPMTEMVHGLIRSERPDRDHLLGLVEQMRAGSGRQDIVEPSALRLFDPAGAIALIDELDGLLAGAPDVPLTNQARIDKDRAYDLLDGLRSELPFIAKESGEPLKTRLAELLPLIDELDDELHNARPVPLTDQVRVDRGKLARILKRMRAAFSQGTLAALTN